MDALFSDWVAIGATLTVVGSLVVVGVLAARILKLINTTHSED